MKLCLALASLLAVALSPTARAADEPSVALSEDCCACSAAAGNYTCTPAALDLGLKPGQFEGSYVRFLSYTTASRLPVVASAAQDILDCTGGLVDWEDVEAGGSLRDEVEIDLGYGGGGEGPGVYDAYAMKSSWAAALADGGLLEGLSPLISASPGLRWTDFLPSARALGVVQSEGKSSVVMLPMDGDYWTLLVRDDLLAEHDKKAPETIEELVELSKYFHGKDLNGDGTTDYGVCGKLLGTQPWVASLFYFMVAPYLQVDSPHIFFDDSTLEPLVNNPGWKKAAGLLKQMGDAGVFSSEKALTEDFGMGRCAFLLALPGTTKKTQLKGVLRADANGTILWSGSAQRVLTPGSHEVLGPAGTLVPCDGTGKVCPYETLGASGRYINRVPFFVTGGWGASIRAGASESKKQLAWAFIAYMSKTANVVSEGVMDAYRSSQFDPVDYLEAGWTQGQFDQFLEVHSSAMGKDTPANVGLDLMLPGYSAYMFDVLETQLQVYLNSSADDALDTLVDETHTGWMQTHNEQGRDAQLRIYRRSVGLQDIVTCPSGEFYSESSNTCLASEGSFDPTILLSVLAAAFVVILGILYVWHRKVVQRNEKCMRDDFAKQMAKCVQIDSYSSNDPAQLTKMFNALDTDKSKFIEKDELRAFMNEKGGKVMSASNFEALWKAIDEDNNNHIDYIEFCVFMARSLESNQVFRRASSVHFDIAGIDLEH